MRRFLRLAPYEDEHWVSLGKLQLSKRKLDLALYSLEKAVVANESNRAAHRLLAMTYRRLGSEAANNGRPQDAIELFHSAIEHNPNDAESMARFRNRLGLIPRRSLCIRNMWTESQKITMVS